MPYKYSQFTLEVTEINSVTNELIRHMIPIDYSSPMEKGGRDSGVDWRNRQLRQLIASVCHADDRENHEEFPTHGSRESLRLAS